MSSITFQTIDKEVRIGGAERHYAGALCERIFWSILDIDDMDIGQEDSTFERLKGMLPRDHYLHETRSWNTISLRNAFRVGADLIWRGQIIDVFALQLNTAIAIGNDAVIFSARMHGQCEIHGYVEGPNRAWLADIIDRGSACGVLREPYQTQYDKWSDVADLLRQSDEHPVVMSYSVTESFPDAGLVLASKRPKGRYKDWTEEQHQEWEAARAEFHDLPWTDQWSRAVDTLRARSQSIRLEIRPDSWSTYRFDEGITAFDLIGSDYKDRLDQKLGLVP